MLDLIQHIYFTDAPSYIILHVSGKLKTNKKIKIHQPMNAGTFDCFVWLNGNKYDAGMHPFNK